MITRSRFQEKSYFPESNGDFPRSFNSSLLNRAIYEVATQTQAPEPMICLVGLSAIATVLQGLIDVELPIINKRCSVSINALTLADSGERKSSVYSLLMQGIMDVQQEKLRSYKKQEEKYSIELDLYDARIKEIKKSLDLSDKEQYDSAINLLLEHKEIKPSKPRKPQFIYENTTVEALLWGLRVNLPSGFLGSAEGGVPFGSPILAATPILNALWGGESISVDRKSTSSFELDEARLTIHIMSQWSAFDGFMKKRGDEVRGNGFLARAFVCAPYTNCGHRQIREESSSSNALNEFNARIRKFAERNIELDGDFIRKQLRFNDEGRRIWVDVANDIERKMQPDGIFFNAKDHASKLAENTARIAALIHYFESPDIEEISVSALREAINLVSYFSGQFMRVFCAPPKHVVDADNLMQWLASYAHSDIRYIKKNNILQFGPAGTRKKKDLEAAIEYLRPNGDFKEIMCRKTKVLDLWPQLPFNEAKLVQDLALDIIL